MERNDSLRVFANDGGYVFQNGKLQRVKWLRTDFKYSHKQDGFMFYRSITTYKLPNGALDELIEKYEAYDTIEGYEKGETAETTYMTCCTPSERHYKKSDDVVCDIVDDKGLLRNVTTFWTWNEFDHCPEKHNLELDKFYYDYTKARFCSDELPDSRLYGTKEEALSFNSYAVVGLYGKKTMRDGINRLLLLDDDQKELVKQFCDIVNKMSGAGIALVGDYGELSAYNIRNVEDYVLDFENPNDTSVEEFEKAKRYADEFKLPIQIAIWGEDNDLYVKRKNNQHGEN